MRRCRNAARVAGLGAHGTTMPTAFPGALLGDAAPAKADFQVYDTHVTAVPEAGDPFQVPHGALTRIGVQEDPPGVVLETARGRTVAGQLARQRDAFARLIGEQRDAQATLLEKLTGQRGFADGHGMERPRIAAVDDLLRRFTAPERLDGARTLVAKAAGGEPRLGFVKLLDPEGEAAAPPDAMPEHWASFLLVPIGGLVVLELLAGPKAASYVLSGNIGDVNADLQQLHFRRAALALTDQQAELTPKNEHRLALRKLEPLKRLRAATRGRLIHNDGWAAALEQALR
jgi:hypothetical protein